MTKLIDPKKKKPTSSLTPTSTSGKVVKPVKPKSNVKVYTKNPSFKPVRQAMEKQKFPFDVVVSHGSRTEACIAHMNKVMKEGGVVLNHPDNIRVASDKYLCKQRMVKLGVRTTPFQTLEEEFKLSFPVVAKLRHGSGGKDMVLINNGDELDSFKAKLTPAKTKEYFLEEMFNPRSNIENHIKTTREFRVHFSPMLMGVPVKYDDEITLADGTTDHHSEVVTNGVIFVVKKLMRDNQEYKFGKNISTGNAYFSRETKIKEVDNLYRLALENIATLMSSLGLDYGAVDLLICPSSNTWCILEVNTAPGFGDEPGITANRYITALPSIINTKKRLS